MANTFWALVTLVWQAEEGAMMCGLEAAAVRVAPSMNAQDVANTVWAAVRANLVSEHKTLNGDHSRRAPQTPA